jgi:hypothetical protein
MRSHRACGDRLFMLSVPAGTDIWSSNNMDFVDLTLWAIGALCLILIVVGCWATKPAQQFAERHDVKSEISNMFNS